MPTKKPNIFILEIKLLHTSPSVWRLIEIQANATLLELAATVVAAMGWKNEHLFQFIQGAGKETVYYGLPHLNEDEEVLWKDVNQFRIHDFLLAEGDKLLFEYDLGDSWMHEIILKGYAVKDTGAQYPRCVAGAMACPPENAGGPGGYAEIKAAYERKDRKAIKEIERWLGVRYNLYAFRHFSLLGYDWYIRDFKKGYAAPKE